VKPDFELTQAEQDERLAAAATSYGVGTKSYNSSGEKKELERQKKSATEKYLQSPRNEVIVQPRCNCLSFPLPHDLSAHRTLKSEYDWTPWQERYVLNKEYNCWELKVQRFQERVR
jgi:hypothetical protein